MSNQLLLVLADVVAICVLTFILYFPRYRRRDMVLALIGINVGILSVAIVLSESDISAGLGLGLFGVLSIIRLRSSELGQEEIAFYFAALALGLLGGIPIDPEWMNLLLMGVLLATLFFAGHPALFPRARHHKVTLDSAISDDAQLRAHLETLLDASVTHTKVRRLDFVKDITEVEVRYTKNIQARGERSEAQ